MKLWGKALLTGCLAVVALAQSKPPGPKRFPTLFPPWPPQWDLQRSTIAQPCNYSGWFDPTLAASFGIISFDWANNKNSWWNKSVPKPDAEDLVEQARLVKAISNETKVWVYRQAQGPAPVGAQTTEVRNDPKFDGFFLKYPNGTDLPGGWNHTMFDFRNDTLVEWFGREYIGGDMCVGSPLVDGFFADDAYGLGAPDSPDHSPVVNISQLTPQDVEKWNEGQLKALILAQNLAVKDYNAWNWQNMEPMCIPGHDDPCPNGWVGMNAPNQKSCLNGGADQAHGKGFAGLRALCTDKEGGERARNIPWLMHIWNNKIAEEGRFPGQGSCTESGDCEHDTCEADGGGVHCASSITDIRQRIAAFLLARGEYAWMGYNWMGCAGSDHSRGGFVDGARWQRPSEWDPLGAMKLDFGNGGKPLDPICREVSDGIFERRFEKIVVRLDCNEWKASFLARNDTTRSSA